MSFTKLSRLFVVPATISMSIWAVGCGKPATEAPAPAEEPAAEAPAGEAPAGEAPAPEAGSTTGGAGAEVPEGGEEAKKEG
ncbi:hypothetical protein [Gimesia chilikensis]|uniref:hypothetical protein n=1 Tax=Gimesia chilikensis TaxID=2605989 RepID=UPI00118989EE|nr:hypothetical protein [Gimesia chilikensis]MCR9230683.1 hypothetical protein [bacterium]QDT82896.1 hypothetical protein MalM14_05260 [Gimesia chilikensis]